MPSRILKESICMSADVDSLSWFEEVLFYRLIVNCDDYGRFDGRINLIKNRLFPLKDDMTVKAVDMAISRLSTVGLVMPYMCDGKPYLQLTGWDKHQQIRAKKSRYPSPDDRDEESCNQMKSSEIKCEQMNTKESKCPRNPIQSNAESNPMRESESNAEKKNARARAFTPPSVEEVAEYCNERQNRVDAQRFVDFYASKGWMVGKSKMVDWRAAVRTWEQKGVSGQADAGRHGSGNVFADMVMSGRLDER